MGRAAGVFRGVLFATAFIFPLFSGCGEGVGDITTGSKSSTGTRISLSWPAGYSYNQTDGAITYPSGKLNATLPAYITGMTLTITGEGIDPPVALNVPLDTLSVNFAVTPGIRTFAISVATSISGLSFADSVTVNLVVGAQTNLDFNLKINAPPTSEGVTVSNSSPFKNESITISISVTDIDVDDVFGYAWSASGGSLSGSGASATWSSDKSGSYSVTVTVDDGRGGVISKSASITAVNRNPVISSVSVDNSSPVAGDTVTATCAASDLDDDPLTYSWSNGESGTTSQHTVTSNNSFTMTCTVADGDGGKTSKSVIVNGVVTTPTAPTGVSASGGDSKVTVSWSAVTDATSYNIYWSTSSGVTTGSTKITGASSSYAHTGRTNGDTYYYVVTAVNSAGESSASNEVNGTAGILIAGLFTDSKLQTCVNTLATTNSWTYASEVTGSLSCSSLGIVSLSGMEYLTNLATVNFLTNSIVDVSPLASLTTNLLNLYLTDNSIVDVSPLSVLTGLNVLQIGSNSISDISSLSALTSLVGLNLESNGIIGLSPLAGLTNLTTLRLDSNSITNVSPLAGLTNLTILYLYSNNITDVSSLSTLTKLETLRINSSSITTGVNTLAGVSWTNPTYFWFQNNSGIPCSDLTALRVTITGLGGAFLPTTSTSGTDCT